MILLTMTALALADTGDECPEWAIEGGVADGYLCHYEDLMEGVCSPVMDAAFRGVECASGSMVAFREEWSFSYSDGPSGVGYCDYDSRGQLIATVDYSDSLCCCCEGTLTHAYSSGAARPTCIAGTRYIPAEYREDPDACSGGSAATLLFGLGFLRRGRSTRRSACSG